MRTWISPYQQEDYNLSLRNIGVNTLSVDLGKNKVFFNDLASKKLTAWEVNCISKKEAKSLKNNKNYDIWAKEDILDIDNVKWSKDNYYTLIIEKDDNLQKIYSSNNRRNIKKANSSKLKFVSDLSRHFQDCVELFAKNGGLRGNLDLANFINLIKILEKKEVGKLHAVSYENKIIASAFVIKSPEVINIRYVASNYEYQSLRAVNFLYHSIIDFYFAKGWKYVDLSGIVPPNHTNKKLVNITRFKKGFSKKVLIFTKI